MFSLEWGGRENIDIGFIGKKWRNTDNNTQFPQGIVCISKKGRVAVFVTSKIKDKVTRVHEEERVVIVEVGGKRIAGVYTDTKGNGETIEE